MICCKLKRYGSNVISPGVSEWFAGRTVLVTGGTGFMGKVLVEKLLRACPDIERILVLVRPKRGDAPQLRIHEVLQRPLFDRLRSEDPGVLKKLWAVEGDMTQNALGLSDADRVMIQQTVSVIFHCAASLHMETSFKVAVINNVLSTHRLLDLAEQIVNLEVFLHLSTAFCHCDREVTGEELYPPPSPPQKIIKLVNTLDEEDVEALAPRFLGVHPNVYTYSKCLTEAIVQEREKKINLVVVRPSIVIPSWREPLPGWVDSLNGIVGIMVAVGKGVLRTMMAGGEANVQALPVDIAINGLITIAYTVANNKTDEVQVYNMTQGDVLPMTWGEVRSRGFSHIKQQPFEGVVWYPGVLIHTNRHLHSLCSFFLHFLPAYFIDLFMAITGHQKFMMRIHHRISSGIRVLEYFSTRKWNFKNDKFLALQSTLTSEDQVKFRMRIEKEFNTDEYMRDVVLGARQYCMREPLSSLPTARKHINRLYYIHMTTVCACYALLLWVGFQLFSWMLGASKLV